MFGYYLIQCNKDVSVDEKFYNGYFPSTVMPEVYDSVAKWEFTHALDFPREKPHRVVLKASGCFSQEKILTMAQSETLLAILNDSANYQWGELGTPEVHYILLCYNPDGDCIGRTNIDLDGMAYSEPYLGRMKWGSLRNMQTVRELIYDIVNSTK
jgi:hypothetical protein